MLVDSQEVGESGQELVDLKVKDRIRRELSLRDGDVVKLVISQTNVVVELYHMPSATVAHACDRSDLPEAP